MGYRVVGATWKSYPAEGAEKADTEVRYYLPESNRVLVEVGAMATKGDANFVHLVYALLQSNGTINAKDRLLVRVGKDVHEAPEAIAATSSKQEVIVGCGLGGRHDDIRVISAWVRKFDKANGILKGGRSANGGFDSDGELEVQGAPSSDDNTTVLRGIGFRFYNGDVRNLDLCYGKIKRT